MVLIHVTTVPETFGFFRGQIGYLKERGFKIHAVSSPGRLLQEVAQQEGIDCHAIAMPRRIAPVADLAALFKLYRLFHRLKPVIVHGHTPKGGLLAMMAGRLARIKGLVYTMHGLPFVTATGCKKKVLIWSETMSCRLATRVIAVSRANLRTAVAAGICNEKNIIVLSHGSANGVDAEITFNPDRTAPYTRQATRQHLKLPVSAISLGYVGRIVRDKGIVELEQAWQTLKTRFPDLYLLMVGPSEPQDPVPEEVLDRLKKDSRVCFTGMVSDPVPYYAAMDLLALPTYREGFPIVPLEAAAMQLPVVGTRVDGCVEAIVDEVTGLLVPPRDSVELAHAIQALIINPEKRAKMGQAGRARVLRDFRPEVIWQQLYKHYLDILKSAHLPLPRRLPTFLNPLGF